MPIDEQILQRLRDNDTTLISLNLASDEIRAKEAKALAKVLESNTTLTELYLDDNQIGDEGAKDLAKALAKNTTLTELYLDDNQIGDEGAKDLAKALAKNTTLTTLYMDRNPISDEGGNEFVKTLVINNTLTALDLQLEEISEEISDQINCIIARNNHFLKKLQTAVYEQLKIGRILLYKAGSNDKEDSLFLTLPQEIREKIVTHLGRNTLITDEQQRLVLNYVEGRIAPVADMLSFFKVTKCERVMKPLQVRNQTGEPTAKRLCFGLD